ncbi:MAG: alpha-1,2-fucosyltransferase [Syntrophomonadaceae bacterium]|nr:alpha-1,2-fucosyltransferase [Syntrophomonadaceae bacterium]
MIIVQLTGGLGNQLFQYAVGRRLAKFHNTNLKLDVLAFEYDPLRSYSLQHFNILENIATIDDIARFKGTNRLSRAFQHLRYRGQPYYKQPIFHEQGFGFDPNIYKTSEDVYLAGYWQSEKYFKEIEAIIRKEFIIKYEMDEKNKELAQHISNCESVSIHIRRGDYVSNPVINSFHGTCELDYYYKCCSLIENKVKDPHFFIFSDDPEWASANLKLNHPTTFITHNKQEKDYEDLRLMSLCKHNIIANSSFSWWGAWINSNTEKLVFAPVRWFNNNILYTGDLIPSVWYRI